MVTQVVRIANAGGYWGDDPTALRRQVRGALKPDYISIDYLAEVTMSILQKQRLKDPQLGYATDFVSQLDPLLVECVQKGIRIITNAGGVNPRACAEALFLLARKHKVPLKIAVIEGDNITAQVQVLRANGVTLENMETHEPIDLHVNHLLSANAYFGAMPVAYALRYSPDIVLCGRVTDTGITLGALMHEFSWAPHDYHKLAHGIVAGHIIECGAQATGGNFTDWSKVTSFLNIGFPLIECFSDGSFVVTKQPDSGGFVSTQTVREQLLYEMGDPKSYIVPDVIADFTTVQLAPDGPHRVRVSGVQGYPPTDLLKVSAAYADGYKVTGALIISGPDALPKARVFASVFWDRLSQELLLKNLDPLEDFHTEYVGHDSCHGGITPTHLTTEVYLRLSARDHVKEKLNLFRKLLPSMILSGPAGVAVTGGAPVVSDVVTYWPTLIPQEHALPGVLVFAQDALGQPEPRSVLPAALAAEAVVPPSDLSSTLVTLLQNTAAALPWPVTKGVPQSAVSDVSTFAADAPVDAAQVALIPGIDTGILVPLMLVAHARSGDKGDTANIGLIGRSHACYLWLSQYITADVVKTWFASLCKGPVKRYLVPNLWALNFLLEESLGGGGTLSLHLDAQGKTFSQALLRCRVRIPAELLQTIAPEDAACSAELHRG